MGLRSACRQTAEIYRAWWTDKVTRVTWHQTLKLFWTGR